MTHRIMCIDMDAFYVSCEQAFKPYLKKKPLAVGAALMKGEWYAHALTKPADTEFLLV